MTEHIRSNRTNQENYLIVRANQNRLGKSDRDFAQSIITQSTRGLSVKQWYWMDVLAERILERVTNYAKRTGKCCFCYRKLTTTASVAAGYGPVCAERNHLPWGE